MFRQVFSLRSLLFHYLRSPTFIQRILSQALEPILTWNRNDFKRSDQIPGIWTFSFKARKYATGRFCITAEAGVPWDLPAVPAVPCGSWGEVGPPAQAGLGISTKPCSSSPAQLSCRPGLAAPALSCLGVSHKGYAELQNTQSSASPASAWSKHVRVATWKKAACFTKQVANWITKCHLPAHNKTSIKILYYISLSVEQACLGSRTAGGGSSVGPQPPASGCLLWHLGGP